MRTTAGLASSEEVFGIVLGLVGKIIIDKTRL
jgi:hypothetical protein